MAWDALVPFKPFPSNQQADAAAPDLAGVEVQLPVAPLADSLVSSSTFEGFLAEVEGHVRESGQLLLFLGDLLRLEITLLRQETNRRVVWGLRSHEDWTFKATILRFARGSEPVHLLLSTEEDSAYRLRGWVVRRAADRFWASPLPPAQADQFWTRCLFPFGRR